MKYVSIINGPNLNLLGTRDPSIYGNVHFDAYLADLRKTMTDIEIDYFQSNIEGELINELQRTGMDDNCIGIVLNAGGYTHTSIALADAVSISKNPVIAVHISNIFAREVERRTDLLVAKCRGMVCGLGLFGYKLAIDSLLNKIDSF
jgi:3-dehydroquinate dehydratase-2